MSDELKPTAEDEPQELIHCDKDGNETREYLPPRMDPTLAVNAALIEGGS
jgi:hypothetical protein